MRKVSPYPLYWILKLEKPKQLEALAEYQMHYWGFNLEVPPMPKPADYTNYDWLMRQAPKHQKRIKV